MLVCNPLTLWYFPVLMPSSNMVSAAEILQGGCIMLINRVRNIGDSLCFLVLILKEVKYKHHQPAKNPSQFLPTLTLSSYLSGAACPFPMDEVEVWNAPGLCLSPAIKCCCCILLVQLFSVGGPYREFLSCCPCYPSVTFTFSCLWFLSLPTLSRGGWWGIIAPLLT